MTPEQVKAARHKLGLTQSGLAAKLMLPPEHGGRTVRSWEATTGTSRARNISGPAWVAILALLAGFDPDHS